jgi:opacity protein-like surface antigen
MLVRHPDGPFHPYTGFGLGWTWFDLDNIKFTVPQGWMWAATGTRDYSAGDIDDDCLGWQLLAGLDCDVTEVVALGIGYRFFQAEPNFSKGDVDIDTKFKTHVLTAGLTLRF